MREQHWSPGRAKDRGHMEANSVSHHLQVQGPVIRQRDKTWTVSANFHIILPICLKLNLERLLEDVRGKFILLLTEAAKKNVIVTGFVFCCCFFEREYHRFLSHRLPNDHRMIMNFHQYRP